MSENKPDLHSAYALKTPEDSRRLYAEWAETYDTGFVAETDYQLHRHTARIFAQKGGQGPVLDVGAGTGACGEALREFAIAPVDATDISPEMLRQAMQKNIYRTSIEADLTKAPPGEPDSYTGLVSSGTFTTGHVGPDAIDNLLHVARSSALFALSINSKHYQSAGFEAKLSELADQIEQLDLSEVNIYGKAATGPNKNDTAFVVTFHKR